MRPQIALILLVALTASPVTYACKELAKFPNHLEGLNRQTVKSYYVISILAKDGNGFSGRVNKSFGGRFKAGADVKVTFIEGEEPHAICPIDIAVGQKYLVSSDSRDGAMEISQFNWLNVPSNHQKYSTYLRDLDKIGSAN